MQQDKFKDYADKLRLNNDLITLMKSSLTSNSKTGQQKTEHEKAEQKAGRQIAVNLLTTLASLAGISIPREDLKEIINHIQYLTEIETGEITILEDKEDHISWVADWKKEAGNQSPCWEDYKSYLSRGVLPPAVIQTMDEVTDKILDQIENPSRPGVWSRRGLVVGKIQSGKTSNYLGLVNKAIDAGYKVIIILAGMTNDLRCQTQIRTDEGILGFDTASIRQVSKSLLGVGLNNPKKTVKIQSLTTRLSDGDFRKEFANNFIISPGGDPLIAVVKKNVSVLNNLIEWLNTFHQLQGFDEVPCLVIDDEADNASIDYGSPSKIGLRNHNQEEETNPTTINRQIRTILNLFPKNSYVGYTATPYANIFIYPFDTEEDSPYGEDLFPKSFIINLPAPSNYYGPEVIFGLDDYYSPESDQKQLLPLLRTVNDAYKYFPQSQRSAVPIYGIPDSLKKAVLVFVLSCSARRARTGQLTKNSMLVHVTRFVDMHGMLYRYLDDFVRNIQKLWRYKTSADYKRLYEYLHGLWETDFVSTTESVIKSDYVNDPDIKPIEWVRVAPHIDEILELLDVQILNGAQESSGLQYGNRKLKSVIAVGGDKFSRGLTLPGLSVSYFTRDSKNYDTLMQMGRWFGYKPGFLDLSRIFVPKFVARRFRMIASADFELRQDFETMAKMNLTPVDYGLQILNGRQGLRITGDKKMKNTVQLSMPYLGQVVSTNVFKRNSEDNKNNQKMAEHFVLSLGEASNNDVCTKNFKVWRNISAEKIWEFLCEYSGSLQDPDSNLSMLISYLLQIQREGYISDWSVALADPKKAVKTISFAGMQVGCSLRSNAKPDDKDHVWIKQRMLLSEGDSLVDYTEDDRKRITKVCGANDFSEISTGVAHKLRKKNTALLLLYNVVSGERTDKELKLYDETYLGFGICLPDTSSSVRQTYTANAVKLRESTRGI